jgi:hypothetical protein
METQTERRLAVKIAEREQTQALLEEMHRGLDGGAMNEGQKKQAEMWRSLLGELDGEIDVLAKDVEADRLAAEKSKAHRRALVVATQGADAEGDGIVYRTIGAYARDVMLTSSNRQIRSHIDGAVAKEEVSRAKQRLELLERDPATTLTSDIAGLTPPQHIAEIMQVIDNSRPLVDAAGRKATLRNLTLTYPQVDAAPVVAAQGTQKTEAGNTGLDVSMVTKTATTYLGGGNLSWQAIEFSDPGTYDLWFREIAADYALKTETDAATVVSASGFLNNVDSPSPIGATPTYAELMAAIAGGAGEVYSNSGRMANAVIMAPDRYWYMLGLTTTAPLAFTGAGALSVNPQGQALRVVVSRGLNSGEIIVGDLDGLLVAENAGAPVRMFVSEPAIAGVEVGLVGAFEAAVVDDGAFSTVTTAS